DQCLRDELLAQAAASRPIDGLGADVDEAGPRLVAVTLQDAGDQVELVGLEADDTLPLSGIHVRLLFEKKAHGPDTTRDCVATTTHEQEWKTRGHWRRVSGHRCPI